MRGSYSSTHMHASSMHSENAMIQGVSVCSWQPNETIDCLTSFEFEGMSVYDIMCVCICDQCAGSFTPQGLSSSLPLYVYVCMCMCVCVFVSLMVSTSVYMQDPCLFSSCSLVSTVTRLQWTCCLCGEGLALCVSCHSSLCRRGLGELASLA